MRKKFTTLLGVSSPPSLCGSACPKSGHHRCSEVLHSTRRPGRWPGTRSITLLLQVNDYDCIGQTPLFYAVTHCQAVDLVPVLLKAGVNVNSQRTSDGWTALHVAAMVGQMEVATLLLQVRKTFTKTETLSGRPRREQISPWRTGKATQRLT